MKEDVRRWFKAYRLGLRLFLISRGQTPDDADDIVQDVFEKCLRNSLVQIVTPPAYLFSMANNAVIDRARRRAAEMRALMTEYARGPAEEETATPVEPDDASSLVARALAALDPED